MRKIFILLCLLCATAAYAGNVDTFGIGAKATAMGGAFSAVADDTSAVYYNPAGLTQFKRSMASFGILMLDPELKVTGYSASDGNGTAINPQDADVNDESNNLFIPHLGYVAPINDKLVAGVALYVPYGLDIKWSNDTAENPIAYNVIRSYYLREVITPTLAYKLNDKLSLGAGISIGKSKSGVERKLYNQGTANTLATALGGLAGACATNPSAANAFGAAAIQACAGYYIATTTNGKVIKSELEDTVNYSYNLGVMYTPAKEWNVGVTYRSRTNTNFTGTTKIEGLTPTQVTTLGLLGRVVSADAETSVDHPEQLQVGVKYQPNSKLMIAADLVRTKWSDIESYTVDFDPSLLGMAEKEYPRHWEDTTQIRLGVDYQLTDMFSVRGGYYYDPTPIPDNYFDVEWPDADKHVYSLGAGINLGQWSVDLVAMLIKSDGKRSIRGESHNMNETYNTLTTPPSTYTEGDVEMDAVGTLYGYGVSVNYKF